MALSPLDAALADRIDLDQYGHDKRLLFALQIDYEIEDIHTVAEDALTDGGDDKACDLVYVDRERGEIVVAQSYEAQTAGKSAPDSKAASLHQAVSWLLSATNDDLPERLQDAAAEVRDALDEKAIGRFRVWYVHNCTETDNVARELEQVCLSVRAHLDQLCGEDASEIDVTAEQVGPVLLAGWYEGAQTPILVNEPFELHLPSGVLIASGDNWRAACTTVPADWLHQIYTQYGSDVFSANVRGYLGSVRSEKNINHGIKESASQSPQKFWAFNNGITAVVNDWTVGRGAGDKETLILSGMAIVNGAQTTGALGSVAASELAGANVLARFIKCDDLTTVKDIIRFNNRQNPTQAADFRSNDRVQRRLRDEFADLKVVDYSGGRRGGASDVIKRPADNMIAAPVAAQALAAFHGTPSLAYHEKGRIWEDDATYAKLFGDRTTARHILFTVSALRNYPRTRSRAGVMTT
jgi:AIPR protein